MKVTTFIAAALTAISASTALAGGPYTFKVEPGGRIETSKDAVQEAVNLVRLNGYSCESVLIMSKMAFTRGYTLVCNRGRYEYEIVDKGGRWTVTYVD